MALREVKPLNENQWNQVTKELSTGPTDESIAIVNEALASEIIEE